MNSTKLDAHFFQLGLSAFIFALDCFYMLCRNGEFIEFLNNQSELSIIAKT